MSSSSKLLEQIAGLTAIRDVELLEVSLLKTVGKFLKPNKLSLYKQDGKGLLESSIRFHNGSCLVEPASTGVSDVYLKAFTSLSGPSADPYHTHYDNGHLYVYDLFESRYSRIYLTLHMSSELTVQDKHFMSGMLQIFCNFCALLDDSQRDALTGLPNRMTFDSQLNRLMNLVPADNEVPDDKYSYWIAMIDIDNFKSINDTYGHLYGDEVLVLMGQVLSSQLSSEDRLFRFGGEEFVLLIEAESRAQVVDAFEALRQRVAEYDFPQVGTVTISIGVVQIHHGTFPVTLLDYADQALYISKSEGRNRVTYFQDLVETGRANKEIVGGGSVDLF